MDIRSKHILPAAKIMVLNAIRERLGKDYDVILEGEGTANEHIHLESDPK